MSRDWTPWEQYAAEQENVAKGLGDIWDFLKNTVIHLNGETHRLCSDEELTLRKQFPVLGKLISNTGKYNFADLYERLSKIDGGVELLSVKDKELENFIASGEGDKDGYLIKWFLGELDPGFHYAEHNNHLFGELLIKEASLHSSKDINFRADATIVPMSKQILDVINAVITYGKFIRSHNYIVPKEDFDHVAEMEKYYHSLPLPAGMSKNRADFERILQIGWYSEKELERLNKTEQSDLQNTPWKPNISLDEKINSAVQRSLSTADIDYNKKEYVKE